MTEAPVPTPATTVHVERLLPAPVAEVFAAWTDPAVMAKWLSPTGYAEVETDLRIGGQFRVTMIDNDLRLEHTGEYLIIDPPRQLSFTWRSPYTGGHASQVDVILAARGLATLIVLSHQRLPDTTRSSHERGWMTILERLAALLVHDVSAATASTKEVAL